MPLTLGSLLSAAFSLAVLTALLAGIFYLIIVHLRRTRLLEAALCPAPTPSVTALPPGADKCCARCGRRLSLLSLGHSRRLHCAHCRLPVCRHCCARARTNSTRWLCVSCRKLRDVRLQSGEWFYQQLRQRFRSTVAALPDTDTKDGEVQEFVERLVESLVGGGLDDVSLYPLSDHPQYTNFCALYKGPLVFTLQRLYASLKMALTDSVTQDGETASDLHSELKELMKQIIQEAVNQPQIMEDPDSASWPPASDDSPDSLGQRSYEDILATAILNKVFAKYQQTKARRKQKVKEQTFDKNSNILFGKTPDKMEGDSPRSDTEDSDSPANSLDSWSESSHHEPLSVTIEEYIEEVTTRYSSDEDDEQKSDIDKFLSSLKYLKRQRAPFPELGKDIVDAGESSSDGEGASEGAGVEQVNPVDSWEENWLFQRRRLRTGVGACQPVPVPMLVPAPHTDQRARIGDLDADEMSDLSDCSDSVLQDLIDHHPSDDMESLENTLERSDSEKGDEALDKQREMFLQYISEDLNNLIKPHEEIRGLSPDTGQAEPTEGPIKAQVVSAVEQSNGSPEETDSSHSYSIVEARNLTVPVVQVDSGEGSLDMQQDSEYTVAYASVAQVRPGDHSPCLTPSPRPKPRTVLQKSETSEVLDETPCEGEDPSSLTELSIPPKPGTIAEREHSKWEKAPPLANNPYSKENIARRQRQRMYLSRHSSSENSIEFPELTGTKEPSLLEIDSQHRRDDCNKYVRDYYVNSAERREGSKRNLPPRSSSAEPRPSSQLANSCSSPQQVSVRVEVEVALSKPSPQAGVPTVTQATALHQVTTVVAPVDDSYISLPSVKELAKQFSNPDEKIPTPVSPVAPRKQTEMRLHSPIRQVHSLTARNISREFRENLRGKSAVPVVTVAREREADSSGHVSEDSGTVSPTPCPHPPPRRLKLQNDIQFWEQLKDQR